MNNNTQSNHSDSSNLLASMVAFAITNTVGAGLSSQSFYILKTGLVGLGSLFLSSVISYIVCQALINRVKLFRKCPNITLKKIAEYHRKDPVHWANIFSPIVEICIRSSNAVTSGIMLALLINFGLKFVAASKSSILVATVMLMIPIVALCVVRGVLEDIVKVIIPLSVTSKVLTVIVTILVGLYHSYSSGLPLLDVLSPLKCLEYPFNLTTHADYIALFKAILFLFFSFCGLETVICAYPLAGAYLLNSSINLAWLATLLIYYCFNAVFINVFNTPELYEQYNAFLAIPCIVFVSIGFVSFSYLTLLNIKEHLKETKVSNDTTTGAYVVISCIVTMFILCMSIDFNTNVIDVEAGCSISSIYLLTLYSIICILEILRGYEEGRWTDMLPMIVPIVLSICCLITTPIEYFITSILIAGWMQCVLIVAQYI